MLLSSNYINRLTNTSMHSNAPVKATTFNEADKTVTSPAQKGGTASSSQRFTSHLGRKHRRRAAPPQTKSPIPRGAPPIQTSHSAARPHSVGATAEQRSASAGVPRAAVLHGRAVYLPSEERGGPDGTPRHPADRPSLSGPNETPSLHTLSTNIPCSVWLAAEIERPGEPSGRVRQPDVGAR